MTRVRWGEKAAAADKFQLAGRALLKVRCGVGKFVCRGNHVQAAS